MKKMINCTWIIWRIGFYPFFKLSWCKIESVARNLRSSLPKQQPRPLPSLLYKSFWSVLTETPRTAQEQSVSGDYPFKGNVSRDFIPLFPHDSNPFGPLINRIQHFRIRFRFRCDNRSQSSKNFDSVVWCTPWSRTLRCAYYSRVYYFKNVLFRVFKFATTFNVLSKKRLKFESWKNGGWKSCDKVPLMSFSCAKMDKNFITFYFEKCHQPATFPESTKV